MKKEIYYWIALFVVIIAAALYYRFYYSSGISLSTKFVQNSSSYGQVYPYQKLYFDVLVNNTGSTPVSDMGVGIEINGNITYAPGVTVPPGKSVELEFNYTPTTSGSYNFSAVADPGKLYNIVDRANSGASLDLVVNAPERPEAYTLLPSNGIVSRSEMNSNLLGFLYYSDLGINYNLNAFKIITLPGTSSFFGDFFDVAGSELENLSTASATYANGNSVSSVWIRGYVKPEIIADAAKGMNLSSYSYDANGNNVTVVSLKDNESMCSWYSNGWIKTVSTNGIGGCRDIVNGSVSLLVSPPSVPSAEPPFLSDAIVANYSLEHGNVSTLGYSAFIGNQSLMSTSITTNNIPERVCSGVLNNVKNVSYCSTYIFGANSVIGPTSLIRTTAIVDGYNLSTFSLVNTSDVIGQIPLDIDAIIGFNVTGPSEAFASAIHNSCVFDSGFGCANPTYSGNSISFTLQNTLGRTATLDSIGCALNGVPKYSKLNATLANDTSAKVTTTCYNNGSPVVGLPYGMAFGLWLNYTVGNTVKTVNGTVFVLG
jgi:hypothetical protein